MQISQRKAGGADKGNKAVLSACENTDINLQHTARNHNRPASAISMHKYLVHTYCASSHHIHSVASGSFTVLGSGTGVNGG